MGKRRSISKKLRFNIFKRDGFCCQYCGSTPPGVVLEVDHIIPVCKDGDNSEENLITSCFDCNRGKSSDSLQVAPDTIDKKTDIVKEKLAQMSAYEDALRESRRAIEKQIDGVEDVFRRISGYEGCFTDKFRLSVKRFIEELGGFEAEESMIIAATNKPDDVEGCISYFCGVCWNKIRRAGI